MHLIQNGDESPIWNKFKLCSRQFLVWDSLQFWISCTLKSFSAVMLFHYFLSLTELQGCQCVNSKWTQAWSLKLHTTRTWKYTMEHGGWHLNFVRAVRASPTMSFNQLMQRSQVHRPIIFIEMVNFTNLHTVHSFYFKYEKP